jgi:hypothetical protein
MNYLHEAQEELDSANAPSQPFVMNSRLASLLDDLHVVMHIGFQKDQQYDRHRIIEAITTAISNAFHDDDKNHAVKAVMTEMMLVFQIHMTDAELQRAAVAGASYYRRLAEGVRGGGTRGPEDVDEESHGVRSRMRRIHDGGDAEEDVAIDGEDDASRRRTGAFWAGRRAEDIHDEREDPRVADTSWLTMPELIRYRADTAHRVPHTRPPEAHMECVSNWLHDLSQMIEPGSP